MPGTAAGWGGGGGRGRQERWEEGQRIELARPHGKNWICFHSSSNKQRGNFASAHLRLNTFRLRGIRDRQFSSRESAVMSKISSGKHSPRYRLLVFCAVASKGSTDHQFTHPPSLFGFEFLSKSAREAKGAQKLAEA